MCLCYRIEVKKSSYRCMLSLYFDRVTSEHMRYFYCSLSLLSTHDLSWWPCLCPPGLLRAALKYFRRSETSNEQRQHSFLLFFVWVFPYIFVLWLFSLFCQAVNFTWFEDLKSQSTYTLWVPQCLPPRPNWDTPILASASVVIPPPPPRNQRGRGHTRLRVSE